MVTELKARRSGVLWAGAAILLCCSVAANVLLAQRLFSPNKFVPAASALSHGESLGLGKIAASPQMQGAIDATLAGQSPPFRWADIESNDYRQYVANLRAAGCPESVIGDLIAVELNQMFAQRAAAIWKAPAPRAYWQKRTDTRPDAKQQKEFVKLSQEKGAIFKELLGTTLNEQQLVDELFLQLHGSEQELLFLPENVRQTALGALAEYDQKEMFEPDRSPSNRDRFAAKLQLLSSVLSSSELEEFKLRNSPDAQNLRMEIQYFPCTPDEFKMLLQARETSGGPSLDLLSRAAAADQVKKLFGEDRAREFERLSDMFYINIRRAAEENGLTI